jgi:hypothetical protein
VSSSAQTALCERHRLLQKAIAVESVGCYSGLAGEISIGSRFGSLLIMLVKNITNTFLGSQDDGNIFWEENQKAELKVSYSNPSLTVI